MRRKHCQAELHPTSSCIFVACSEIGLQLIFRCVYFMAYSNSDNNDVWLFNGTSAYVMKRKIFCIIQSKPVSPYYLFSTVFPPPGLHLSPYLGYMTHTPESPDWSLIFGKRTVLMKKGDVNLGRFGKTFDAWLSIMIICTSSMRNNLIVPEVFCEVLSERQQ